MLLLSCIFLLHVLRTLQYIVLVLFSQLSFKGIWVQKNSSSVVTPLCIVRFPSGIIFCLPEGFHLTFLVWVLCWWISACIFMFENVFIFPVLWCFILFSSGLTHGLLWKMFCVHAREFIQILLGGMFYRCLLVQLVCGSSLLSLIFCLSIKSGMLKSATITVELFLPLSPSGFPHDC